MGLNYKIVGGCVLVVAVCLAIMGWQTTKIANLRSDNAIYAVNESKYEDAIKTQAKVIKQKDRKYEEALANEKQLREEKQTVQEQLSRANVELNNYRERLTNVAIIKPTLVERRINRAVNRLMHSFSEATDDSNISDTGTEAGLR